MLIADGVGSNEERADLGAKAVQTVTHGGVPAVATIEDTLAYIAHLCDRCGLPAAATFHEALRRYHHRLEETARAQQLGDGEIESIEEINAHSHTDRTPARSAA